MKILYIFRSLAVWGGIERVLVDKMNNLVSMYNHEVFMLTSCQGNHPIPYPLGENVHIKDLGIQFHKQYQYSGVRRLLYWWRSIRLFEERLSKEIYQLQPDVIVCTTADPVNSVTNVKGNIPLIVESHSICYRTIYDKRLRKRLNAKLLLKGMKRAACVVALTEEDAAEWRKVHQHVKTIPNMVNLNQGGVASLCNKRLIWVGRFDYQKRPMEVIELWKSIYRKFPDWHLDIIGEGEQKQLIEKTMASLGLNIHIFPPTSLIFDYYRNSSILVSTSLFEPFGLVIPEAMSCGLPVVAYDCPFGPGSIISDGINGYLVKKDNREMMIEKICMLMDDISMRREMGKAAFESASRFSANHIMPMWNNLFLSILNK